MKRIAFFIALGLSLLGVPFAQAFTEIKFQLAMNPTANPSSTIFTDIGLIDVTVSYDETAPYTVGLVEPDTGSTLQGALLPATLQINYNNGQYVGTSSGTLSFFQVPADEWDIAWDGITFTSSSFTSGFGPDGSLSVSKAFVFLYGPDSLITDSLIPDAQSIQDKIDVNALRIWFGEQWGTSSIDVYPGAPSADSAFTVTTVPEPSTWALFAVSIPAIWWLHRRTNR